MLYTLDSTCTTYEAVSQINKNCPWLHLLIQDNSVWTKQTRVDAPTTLQPLFQSQPSESAQPPSAPGISQRHFSSLAPYYGPTTTSQIRRNDSTEVEAPSTA